jgi:hypothetical protein
VISPDVLEVGEVLKIVFRNGEVLFLLLLSDAARNNLDFFEALPREQVTLTSFEALADYKPIIKRGDSTLGYNEFDFFLENKEYRPFDGCKIEICDTFTKYVFLIF